MRRQALGILLFVTLLVALIPIASPLRAEELPSRVSQDNPLPVAKLLDSPRPERQIWAARVLGELGQAAEPASPALIRVIKGGTAEARVVASIALVKINPDMKDFIPILLQALANEAAEQAGVRADDLGALKMMTLEDDALMRWAALTKREIDTSIMPLLFQELRTEDPDIRILVLLILGNFSLKVPQAFTYVLKGLEDPDPGVRVSVVVVLERLAPTLPGAAPALGQACRDPDKKVRSRALRAVSRVGAGPSEVLPALLAGLRDPEADVRYAALFALGSIGPPARGAAPAVRELLEAKELEDRLRACAALIKIDPSERLRVVPVLAAVAEDQSVESSLRVRALDLVTEVGPEGVKAVPALVTLLGEKTPEVRTRAMEVLGRLGPEILPAVERSLGSPSGAVRAGAVEVLLSLPADQVGPIPLLVRSLKDSDRSVRYLAAEGLARFGAQAYQAVPELVEALRDPEERVRASVGNALVKMGALAVPALTEASEGPDPVLQPRAAALLRRIREP